MDSVARVDGADQGAAMAALQQLQEFRGELFESLGRRRDELFELTDALLCTDGPVSSLVGLCLAPEHRRGHGALYDAVNHGQVDAERLRRVLAGLPLPRMFGGRIVLAVDASPWLRPDAETCPERLFCHVYGRGRESDQLIPGWPYQLVAALESGPTSWTAILDARRLGPADEATAVTAAQLRAVVGRLQSAGHWRAGDPPILVVLDSGYDVCRLAYLLADLPIQLIGRLRADRVMLGPVPPPPDGRRPIGRPRRHGAVMALADPGSWPAPTTESATETVRYGRAEATSWDRMHPRLTHRGAWADHPGPAADRGGHADPAAGGASARPARGQAGVAVDLGHRRRRRPGHPLLAGVPAPLRPGAHRPAVQADPGLDRPEDSLAAGGRPLDLAGHRRAHPAAAGPPARRGSAPALGATAASRSADPRPGPAWVSLPTRKDLLSGQRTETHPPRAGTPTRGQEPAPRSPPRRRQDRHPRHRQHQEPAGHGLNDKLRR